MVKNTRAAWAQARTSLGELIAFLRTLHGLRGGKGKRKRGRSRGKRKGMDVAYLQLLDPPVMG